MKRGNYYQIGELRVKRGNLKLGPDTLILNMGPAKTCPAARFCKVRSSCYAVRDEGLYPGALEYRRAQERYWKTADISVIKNDFAELFDRHAELASEIKYLRFNESGDFYSQSGVEKLDKLASWLKRFLGIVTYGYTARPDLDFRGVSFLVKGSGHDQGNNGRTDVVETANEIRELEYHGAFVCPGNCAECPVCKEANGQNIVFINHVKPVSRTKKSQYTLF